MTIECTLCFSDPSGEYYKNAYIVLMSIFANTDDKIRVHIISDETIHGKKEQFSALCSQHGQTVLFHTAPVIPPHIMDKIPDYLGAGSLYRFFIHNLIDVDKVIYLDCDVICERNIGELFNIDLGDHILAARRDTRGEAYHRHQNTPYLEPSGYYNSGVLLMNLQKIRTLSPTLEKNIFIDELASITTKSHKTQKIEFPDQDVINSLFRADQGVALFLDKSFNFFPIDDDLAQDNDFKGKIIHFLGAKPWGNLLFPHHMLYWKYYKDSPWGDDLFDRILQTQHDETFWMLEYALKRRKYLRWERDIDRMGWWGFLKNRLNKNRKRG